MKNAQLHINSGCHSLLKSMASISLFLILLIQVKGQVITVKQDGTGDYTMIQDAVDASADGDTVIVFPGTYYENIDLTEKAVVLASSWIISHEDSIIAQTVIDGNQAGSCIRSLSSSEWIEITGLTLINGNGTNYLESMYPDVYGSGGGIYIEDSKARVTKCKIINNFGWFGGGILSRESSLFLAWNTICNNWAAGGGGGIQTAGSNVVFDSILLNNVYLNYSTSCADIAIMYNDSIQKIWLDTSTVIYPDRYYIGKLNDWFVHIARPPVSVLIGKIDQVNDDLYVSPTGLDSNSGLSPENPLKTISYALLKIASDSVNPKKVHIADGVYSRQLTGEHPPIQLKNFVTLEGESMENTIIDCENKYEGARFAFGQQYTMLKNLSFLNGNGYYTAHYGGISTGYSKKIVFDSVALVATTGKNVSGLYCDSNDTIIFRNSIFQNCAGYKTANIFVHPGQSQRHFEFVSCRFSGNHPDSSNNGAHTTLSVSGLPYASGRIQGEIINCLFNDNIDSVYWSGGGSAALSITSVRNLDIINSTFANNLTVNNPGGGAIGVMDGSAINLINCVLSGNYGYHVCLGDLYTEDADTVSVNHSLVQDGQEGIIIYGDNDRVVWGEGNLDSDPLFLGSEAYPYAIDFGSPCIDAGTLDLPPGIVLPEYDLAGNPRVWGASVDMGAYEYGPWVSVKEVGSRQSAVGSQMGVNPNPFSYGTYIEYELQKNGRLDIGVYSLPGMKVRTLAANQGSVGDKGNFHWDGTDSDGNDLPAGVYFVRMTMDGKEVETVKVVKSEQ
jgi:hypothetical protein